MSSIHSCLDCVKNLTNSYFQNLAAKNSDGQTSVHLAVYYGHLEVLELLLKHKASANSGLATNSIFSGFFLWENLRQEKFSFFSHPATPSSPSRDR